MKKLLLHIIILIALSLNGIYTYGQSEYDVSLSQYMTEGMLINPSFAGSREVLSTSLFYRRNWIGIKDAIEYQAISAHAPLRNYKMGLGMFYIRETQGISEKNAFYFNYAYRINAPFGKISLGLRGGLNLFSTHYSRINTTPYKGAPADPVFVNREGTENSLLPNFGAGIYYYSKKFFLGASVPSFFTTQEVIEGGTYELEHNFTNYNYYFTGGFKTGNPEKVQLLPSGMIKYRQNTPVQYEGHLSFIFLDERFTAGLGYGSPKTALFLLQVKANEQLRIGLTYNRDYGDLLKYTNGTMEIMLRYEFKYIIRAENPLDF